jgi:hypothetical protein
MGQYEGYRVLAFHSYEENCYSSLRLLGQDATNSRNPRHRLDKRRRELGMSLIVGEG